MVSDDVLKKSRRRPEGPRVALRRTGTRTRTRTRTSRAAATSPPSRAGGGLATGQLGDPRDGAPRRRRSMAEAVEVHVALWQPQVPFRARPLAERPLLEGPARRCPERL